MTVISWVVVLILAVRAGIGFRQDYVHIKKNGFSFRDMKEYYRILIAKHEV